MLEIAGTVGLCVGMTGMFIALVITSYYRWREHRRVVKVCDEVDAMIAETTKKIDALEERYAGGDGVELPEA